MLPTISWAYLPSVYILFGEIAVHVFCLFSIFVPSPVKFLEFIIYCRYEFSAGWSVCKYLDPGCGFYFICSRVLLQSESFWCGFVSMLSNSSKFPSLIISEVVLFYNGLFNQFIFNVNIAVFGLPPSYCFLYYPSLLCSLCLPSSMYFHHSLFFF